MLKRLIAISLIMIITNIPKTLAEKTVKPLCISETECDWIIKKDNKNAQAYFYRGLAKIDKQNFIGAIDDFNIAIKLTPNYAQAYLQRGIAKGKIPAQPVTINYNGKTLQVSPANYDVIKDASRAIEIDPNYEQAYYIRGCSFMALFESEQALKDFSTMISLNPNSGWGYYQRGLAKYDLGNTEDAFADLEKAKTIFKQQKNDSAYDQVDQDMEMFNENW